MKELKKSTGDGSAKRHHMPSKLAIKKAIAKDTAERVRKKQIRKPTDPEMAEINRRIDANSKAMVVDKKVHKVQKTTGDQNKQQSEIDKNDLGKAAKRDAHSVVEDTKELGPKSSSATQEGAKEISSQTHESIMAENRTIVDDVLAGR